MKISFCASKSAVKAINYLQVNIAEKYCEER